MFVQIEKATELKQDIFDAVQKFSAKQKPAMADVRFEISNGQAAYALNGNVKQAARDYGIEIGARVFAGKKMVASGFIGKSLGEKDLSKIKEITAQMLEVAFKRAKLNSIEKEKTASKMKEQARGLYSTAFAEIPVLRKEWEKEFRENPMDKDLDFYIKRCEEVSKRIGKISGVSANSIGLMAGIEKKIFTNSEGSLIEQTRAITEPSVFISAKGTNEETFHEWMSDSKGLEVLEGDNPHGKTLEEFAEYLAEGTAELANAKTAKFEKDVEIITDPWFNTLVSHEICGHPSEADRALKRETAWAGRAWWFNNMDENMFGKEVGSPEMTIVSDPTFFGYGNYGFDDEGTPAKKVVNIENGILKGFMNSRETAAILNAEPNGHMRANSAASVPLIRMSNTYFEKGTWKKEELIEETRKGYYIIGEKTPSIGESRQNFNITCWKAYRIENGEIMELYRNAGIEYDSNKFFKSIKAANDVMHFNVPNCGKGTPMQTMRLSNGGPHLKGIANLTGKH